MAQKEKEGFVFVAGFFEPCLALVVVVAVVVDNIAKAAENPANQKHRETKKRHGKKKVQEEKARTLWAMLGC